jgi:hypothetical protein
LLEELLDDDELLDDEDAEESGFELLDELALSLEELEPLDEEDEDLPADAFESERESLR